TSAIWRRATRSSAARSCSVSTCARTVSASCRRSRRRSAACGRACASTKSASPMPAAPTKKARRSLGATACAPFTASCATTSSTESAPVAMTDFAYSGRELEVLADLPGYYDWIVESFQPHLKGAAAEFGAGLGTISGRIRAAVERLDLIEPSADMIDGLKGRFAGDPAVRVFQETQESFARACAAQSYDTIVMVNVLEHIDD